MSYGLDTWQALARLSATCPVSRRPDPRPAAAGTPRTRPSRAVLRLLGVPGACAREPERPAQPAVPDYGTRRACSPPWRTTRPTATPMETPRPWDVSPAAPSTVTACATTLMVRPAARTQALRPPQARLACRQCAAQHATCAQQQQRAAASAPPARLAGSQSRSSADVRVYDLIKPFKDVPKEKVDDALTQLDIWDLRCVLLLHLLRLGRTCAQPLTSAPHRRAGRSRGRRHARRRGTWPRACCRA